MVNASQSTASAANRTGAIRIAGVRKAFPPADTAPDDPPLVVLDNINLEFGGGEFISLIGPSGCGKSTLLRLIAGLALPDSGTLSLDGEVIRAPGYERGLVFQDPTLFPWKTIYENIAFGLRARGIYKEEKQHIPQFFRLVGLTGFEKAYPHHLSGGMAQRASLARALVNKPKALLLDEPLGALDAFTRMNMQDEILKIWETQGMTAVMVTHDVDEAVYMADRIVVMSARPAKIEQVIAVEMGRPRLRSAPDFLALRAKILQILHFAGNRQES
ncbi:ABC transporter ATP-binding protein [Treponema endosymbiont of Eucomonympha sp.]|uniref:ABC transporter ATP-binding protein n=1 Tax=Treponema endosymbiont of Eucomonympha sp. TaxID=1580831 RepID=UPI000750ECE5|nr:ABC transporter ATP-binding protein [Treponema endosymbiont of Eucomonympha sp.]